MIFNPLAYVLNVTCTYLGDACGGQVFVSRSLVLGFCSCEGPQMLHLKASLVREDSGSLQSC